MLALAEGLRRQDRQRREDESGDQPSVGAVEQAAAPHDAARDRKAEHRGEEDLRIDDDLRVQTQCTGEGDCGQIKENRGRRIEFEHVDIEALPIEQLFARRDQPRDIGIADDAVALHHGHGEDRDQRQIGPQHVVRSRRHAGAGTGGSRGRQAHCDPAGPA